MTQMAKILQPFPDQPLRLTSLDYQPEREEYLLNLKAVPESHALLMSRSALAQSSGSKTHFPGRTTAF